MSNKQGLDDFLVANPVAAFWALVDKAVMARRPKDLPKINEAVDDPNRLARIFLEKYCTTRVLRYYREKWFRFDGVIYREIVDDFLKAEIHKTVKEEFDRIFEEVIAKWDSTGKKPVVNKVSRSLITNVQDAIRSLTIVDPEIKMPTWLEGAGEQPTPLIAMKNGLLDVNLLFSGNEQRPEKVLRPHSPLWFSVNYLPYNFDPSADCPRWRAMIEQNLEQDHERVAVMQEWFGYCLLPNTDQQRFLLMTGNGGNGKGAVSGGLRALLGEDNCSAVTLEQFSERFDLGMTLGKLLNIAGEIGEIDKVAEGKLKSFTSGDLMSFDVKYGSMIQAVPTARLVLATNNLPRFSDRSDGLWRRVILMPFNVRIAEEDKVYGMDKSDWWMASGEMPGLFNWALVGLKRLRDQGRFSTSKVCEKSASVYRKDNNPAEQFLLDRCKESTEYVVSQSLYRAYVDWAKERGYHPLADAKFGAEVKRVFPKVEKGQKTEGGSRTWVYLGIEMSSGFDQ